MLGHGLGLGGSSSCSQSPAAPHFSKYWIFPSCDTTQLFLGPIIREYSVSKLVLYIFTLNSSQENGTELGVCVKCRWHYLSTLSIYLQYLGVCTWWRGACGRRAASVRPSLAPSSGCSWSASDSTFCNKKGERSLSTRIKFLGIEGKWGLKWWRKSKTKSC